METKTYEYYLENEIEISEERKQELISMLKDNTRKNSIALYKVLGIGKNDAEYNFLYDWLEENDINIRGTNVTMAGEIPNYTHIARTRGKGEKKEIEEDYYKKFEPDVQEGLFRRLKMIRQSEGMTSEYYTIREKLVTHNIGLARYVANAKGLKKYNISQQDKESYALIGLMNAVDHFDVDKGYQFSSYACKAMYFQIGREIMQIEGKNFIFQQELEELEEAETEFMAQTGRIPNEEELNKTIGYTPEKIRELRLLRYTHESRGESETEIPDDEEIFMYDNIYYTHDGNSIDTREETEGIDLDSNVEDAVTTNAMKEEISRVLGTLNKREEEVLRLRFGLEDGKSKTLEEVAKKFGVHRERIRQIEAKALRKLRHPSRSRKLRDYLDER